MRLNNGMIALMLSAMAIALPFAGCAGGDVVYDPYRHDYLPWNHVEDRFYLQWEISTNRNHMDFQRRSSGDRQAYWDWRHGGSSTGHGRH